MSQVCEKCVKRPTSGKTISHSHRKTNRWFRPNLAVKSIVDPKTGKEKKAKICIRCLRTSTKDYIQQKWSDKK